MPDNRPLWRSFKLSAAAGAIVAALFLIQILSLPAATKIQRLLVDLGHVPLFALIAFALLKLTRAGFGNAVRCPAPRDYLIVGLVVSVLAVASEALQLLDPDRVASVSDILRNSAGGALGLLLCAAYYRPTPIVERRRARPALVIAASVLLACLLFPLVWTSASYGHRRASWPTILGAGYRLELPYSVAYESEIQVVGVPKEWRLNDRESALRLRIRNCGQCGILVQELNRDWKGLTGLCLEVTNPGNDPLRLSVRLGDATMFFRSSAFDQTAITIPAGTRVNRCLPLSAPAEPKPSANGQTGYRSLALLSDADETLEYFIHRIWLR